VDPDDAGLFARRLAWDGLDEAGVARPTEAGAPVAVRGPDWWDELEDLRAACREAAGLADVGDNEWADGVERSATDSCRHAQQARIPFVHLLRPPADTALDRLRREVRPDAFAVLSPGALDDARHALLLRLAEISARVLFEEFTAGRPFGRSAMLALSPPAGAGAPRKRYVAFCRRHLRDGLGSLLAAYPVLGRLLVTVCRQWRETLAEFLERIRGDRDLLGASLGVDRLSIIQGLDLTAGDRHHSGRGVATAEFTDGTTIVYRPRDVRGEARFGDLTTMLAAQLDPGWIAAPRVIPVGEHYGYASFVHNAQCTTRPELERFYRNAGRLLAVLHLLGATDFHSENLVASGSSLVVVDAETLFEDRVVTDVASPVPQEERIRAEPLALSILQTLMLPAWLPEGDGAVLRDVSALGADPAPRESVEAPGWKNVNTDLMVWSVGEALPAHPRSLPVGRGEANPVDDHVDELIRGFRDLCTLVLRPDVRRELEARIRGFAGARRRVLLRHTRTYAIIQQRALAPRALRSAAARGCELERLSRAFLLHRERPPLWPLFHAELRDLEDLDIPCFEHRLGSTVLSGTGVSLGGAVAGDALDRALSRVASLSPEDIGWQTRLIRAALKARGSRAAADHAYGPAVAAAGRADSRTPGESGRRDAAAGRRFAIDPATAEQEARHIAGEIVAAALTDGRGDVTWLTPAVLPSLLPEARRVALWLIPDGLYDGRAGVFAFLRAWSADAGAVEDGRLAQACLTPVLKALDSPDHERFRYLRDLGLGLNGVGGLLRVFCHLATGSAADRDEWRKRRDRLAAAVDQRLVAAGTELDLLAGAAGAVAPLAAVYAERPSEAGARTLAALAARLLEAQDTRTGAWFTDNPVRPLAGLSHGASGIGLALLEAGAVLCDERMVDAAARAFAYEAAVFDHAAGDWPDFRGGLDDEPRFVTGWCHGAPGIALARMRALQLAPGHRDAAQWRWDLEAAAAATMAAPLGETDHLCCGNLGRAAVLQALGAAHGLPDWSAAGRALTAAVIRRAAAEGGYRLPQLRVGAGDGLVFPGLMSGSAGIGLHLMAETGRADLGHLLL
jgi:type 2 lantibiotic biosynthesis protein LanM